MLVGGRVLPASKNYDAQQPQARELYWEQANKAFFEAGMDAWWCESSEPFTPEWARNDRPDAADQFMEFYQTASQYMPAELTNTYGLYHALGIWEGQRRTNEAKRVCNLTRSSYTGTQKYGTIRWSGDISATWDTLKKQIPAGLHMRMSGVP